MDDMSEREQAMLYEFGRSTFDAAVAAGYLIPPWNPSREAYVAIHEYLIFGFSPAQAAEAIFATRQ